MKSIKVIFVLLFSVMFALSLTANMNIWQGGDQITQSPAVQKTTNTTAGIKYVPGTLFNFKSRMGMVHRDADTKSATATVFQDISNPIYPSQYTVQGTPLVQTSTSGITNAMTLLQDSSRQYYLGYAFYANSQWIEKPLLTIPQNIFSGTVYLMSAAFYNTNSPYQYGFAILTDTQGDQYGFMCINGTWSAPLGDMPGLNNQATNIYVNGSANNAALVIAGTTSFAVVSYAENNWNLTTLPSSITNISQIAFNWAPTGSGEYLSAAILAQNGLYQIVSGTTSLVENQDNLNSGAFTNMTLPTFNAYTGDLSSVIIQTSTSEGSMNNYMLTQAGSSTTSSTTLSSGNGMNVLDLGTWTLPWETSSQTSPIVPTAVIPAGLASFVSAYQNSSYQNYFTPDQTIATVCTLNSSNTYNVWLWTQNNGWVDLPININASSPLSTGSLCFSICNSFSGSSLMLGNENIILQGANNNVLTTTPPYGNALTTQSGPQLGEEAVIGTASTATIAEYPSLSNSKLYLWTESDNVWSATPFGYSATSQSTTPTFGSYLPLTSILFNVVAGINWTNGTASSDFGVSSAIVVVNEENATTKTTTSCKLYATSNSGGTILSTSTIPITLQNTDDEISSISSNGSGQFVMIESEISGGGYEDAYLGLINDISTTLTCNISTPILLSTILPGSNTLDSVSFPKQTSGITTAPDCAVIETNTGTPSVYGFYYITTASPYGSYKIGTATSDNAWDAFSPNSYFVNWNSDGTFGGLAILITNNGSYQIYSCGNDSSDAWNQWTPPSGNSLPTPGNGYALSSFNMSSNGTVNGFNILNSQGTNEYTYNPGDLVTIPVGSNSTNESNQLTNYTITAVGPYGSSIATPNTGTWEPSALFPSSGLPLELYLVTLSQPTTIPMASIFTSPSANGYYCYASVAGPNYTAPSGINQYGFPINGFELNSNGLTPNQYSFYIVAPQQVSSATSNDSAYSVTFTENDLLYSNATWTQNSTSLSSEALLLPQQAPIATTQPATLTTQSPTRIGFASQTSTSTGGANGLLLLNPNGVCATPVEVGLYSGDSSSLQALPNTNIYYNHIVFYLQVITTVTGSKTSSYAYYPITESPSSNTEGIYMQPSSIFTNGLLPQYGYSDTLITTPLINGNYDTYYFYCNKAFSNPSTTSLYNIVANITAGSVNLNATFPVTSTLSDIVKNTGLINSQACLVSSSDNSNSTWTAAEFNLSDPESSSILSASNDLWNPYYDTDTNSQTITPNYFFNSTLKNNGIYYATYASATTALTDVTSLPAESISLTASSTATTPMPSNPLFFVFPEGINEETLAQRVNTEGMPVSVLPATKTNQQEELTGFNNSDMYNLTNAWPENTTTSTATPVLSNGDISPLSFISFDDSIANGKITSNSNSGNAYYFAFSQYGDPVGQWFNSNETQNALFTAKYSTDVATNGDSLYPMHLVLYNNYSSTLPLVFTATKDTPSSKGINAAGLLNSNQSSILIPYGGITDIVTMNFAQPLSDSAPDQSTGKITPAGVGNYAVNTNSCFDISDIMSTNTLASTEMLRGKSYFNMTNSSKTTGFTPLNVLWTYATQSSASNVSSELPPCLEWGIDATTDSNAQTESNQYDEDLQIAPYEGLSNQHFSVGYAFAPEGTYTTDTSGNTTCTQTPSPYTSGQYYALLGTTVSAVATGVEDGIANTIGVPFIGVMVNNKPLDGINDVGWDFDLNREGGTYQPIFYNSTTNDIISGVDITQLDLNKGSETLNSSLLPSSSNNIYTPLTTYNGIYHENISTFNNQFSFGPASTFSAPVTGVSGGATTDGYYTQYTPWAFMSYFYSNATNPTIEYYPYNTAPITNVTI